MLQENVIINDEKSSFTYIPDILDEIELLKLETYLDSLEFKKGFLTNKTNKKEIPRLQLWFHQTNKYFCSEWKYQYDRWKSNSYTPYLLDIQSKVNDLTQEILKKSNINFNSCLINKYRDGSDSIKAHQDTPYSFGYYPIISGLSLKSTRKIIIKPIKETRVKNIEFILKPNSLFIMSGASQKYFTHEIPKSDSNLVRYSLTFRKHLL